MNNSMPIKLAQIKLTNAMKDKNNQNSHKKK